MGVAEPPPLIPFVNPSAAPFTATIAAVARLAHAARAAEKSEWSFLENTRMGSFECKNTK
jgi:hypothetical protein